MTTFDDVMSKAKIVAETAGKKTSEFVEVTRLKMDASEIEKDMATILEGLGRLVYDAHKTGDDITAQVDECVAKLDERQDDLLKLRQKIDEYKNKVRCSDCGAQNPVDAVYCKNCGAKLGNE
jgi:ribosomal protein L40E